MGRVLGAASNVNTESSPADLTCPICNMEMLTLAQLNRHIDDEHTDQPESQVNQAATHANQAAVHTNQAATQQFQTVISGTHCAHPNCPARLHQASAVHCKLCGLAHCAKHVQCRRRLNGSGKPDVHGYWRNVCLKCFNSAPWASDDSGLVRNLSKEFDGLRKLHMEARSLVVDRLEKRMVRLVSNLLVMEKEAAGGLLSTKDQKRKRDFERSLVAWENEQHVRECRLCKLRFTYFNRKHHCRTCGLVVCGAEDRGCSRDVALGVLCDKLDRAELASTSRYPVRICADCRSAVFSHKNYMQHVNAPPPRYVQLYGSLRHKRDQIEALLPRFAELCAALTHTEVLDAGVVSDTKRIRMQLLSVFSQCDGIARRLKACDAETPGDEHVKQHMYAAVVTYLQDKMLPLQALPKVLQRGCEPQISKADANALQNKLVVLEEQKMLVTNMVTIAKERRRFDELAPLQASLRDLQRETDAVRSELGSLAPI